MIPMNQRRFIGLLACLVVIYVRRDNFHCNAQGECAQSILGDDDNDYSDYVDDLENNDFEHKLQQLQLVLSNALELRDERYLFNGGPWKLDRGVLMNRLDDEFVGYTERFNVLLDGAVGDGITNDTNAFLAAWNKACDARNGEVYVPSGYTFLVYPSTFSGPCRCNIRFAVEGTIVAPEEISAWDGLNVRYWLLFIHLDYFTLKGSGTFNGRGYNWWVCKEDKTCERAPTTVTVLKSSHVTVRTVTFVDAPQVHINFQDITEGHVKGITVLAPWSSPNTDGIHISGTTDFVVRNCYVATGDDCVSIVSGSRNIGVYDTYCGIGCHGISVGSLGYNGQHANVTQVQVKNCQLDSTTNGLRIKTWQGGTGIASNIDFRNIKMSNVSNPIIIDQFYCPPSQTEEPCSNLVSESCPKHSVRLVPQ